jgi:hypothetical protein
MHNNRLFELSFSILLTVNKRALISDVFSNISFIHQLDIYKGDKKIQSHGS